ncbi:MAG TPA: alpha/beta fold hydrolase [Candidatus Acidoferrales bacterium]|nr:alpha/beta fold hydrolase [Candidatus Acidoferrales bacterium]
MPAPHRSRVVQSIGSLLALALFVLLALGTISGYLVYQIVTPPRNPATLDINLLMGHPTAYKFDLPFGGTREGWFFPGLLHAPTIVLCHGYGSQRADILTLVTALQEHQFNVFLFDFTGHGYVPGRTSLGYGETQELLAAIQGLAKRDDIDQSHFGVWGVDLGAYAALSAAARDARIKAIAMDSAYDRPVDFLIINVGRTGLGSLPGVHTFCSLEFRILNHSHRGDPPASALLPRLQSIPKLFIETTDKPELSTSTLRMFQAATGPKDQFVDSQAYSEMSDEDRRNYETRVVNFFLLHLPLAGQPSQ